MADAGAPRDGTLKAERDRHISLSFVWADLLFEVDPSLHIVYAAGATEPFFGKSPTETVGCVFPDLVAPADSPLACQLLSHIRQNGRMGDEAIRIVTPRGAMVWMSLAGYCLDPDGGNLFVGMRMGGAGAKAAAKSVPRDESGLFDATTFSELAADRLKKLAEAGETAEVTLLALDGMEVLKERLDEKANQRLVQSVGAALKANSLGGDSAAVVGDGKFSIMHQSGADLSALAAQIESMVRAADPAGEGVKVASATLALEQSSGLSEQDLAKGLTYALNKFKDTAADGLVNLKDLAANMGQLVDEAVSEVAAFRTIVKEGQFFIALQPIVHVGTGEIHHYEALCRFDKAAGESPFRYITFAEETGLIHEFDLAMVNKAIEWLNRMPRNSDKYKLAVNVSGFSIGQESYVHGLHKLLRENLWTRDKLMFEITESSRMSDLEAANNFIQGLRKWGYHVCLDDFGAGAASFQYLSVLDVDVVKLDGSAIKNAQKAQKGRAFLSALTELCRRMQVETIAEMVDSPESLDFCRDCGCNYVQGFLFGRPSKEVKDFSPLPQSQLFGKGQRLDTTGKVRAPSWS